MEKKKAQEYSARIVQANRTELLVIIYEIIQEELSQAIEAYNNKDEQLFQSSMKSAQKFLNELMGTLDYRYEVAYNLMSVYKYVNKVIIEDLVKGQADQISECISMIGNLKAAYEGIVSQDHSGPVMENVQKLYAGLTYGKGTLNEISVNERSGNRGLYA